MSETYDYEITVKDIIRSLTGQGNFIAPKTPDGTKYLCPRGSLSRLSPDETWAELDVLDQVNIINDIWQVTLFNYFESLKQRQC